MSDACAAAMPEGADDVASTRMTRRRFVKGTAAAGVSVWAVPLLVTVPARAHALGSPRPPTGFPPYGSTAGASSPPPTSSLPSTDRDSSGPPSGGGNGVGSPGGPAVLADTSGPGTAGSGAAGPLAFTGANDQRLAEIGGAAVVVGAAALALSKVVGSPSDAHPVEGGR